MAIKIAHASIDENKKAHGGLAGDQTKKECCIRTWYGFYTYVIRFKDRSIADKVAKAMELAVNNDKIGYDQYQRNTLLTHARKVGYNPSKVTTACETDCSALVALACMYAGVAESALVVSGNSANTRNLRSLLLKTGLVEVYSDSKYTSSDKYLMRGDILLKEGSHVVVTLENGSCVTTTSNEYTHEQFIKEVQSAIGAKVDGKVGKETLGKVITISKTKNNKHALVKPLQRKLNALGFDVGNVDGIYGVKTSKAVGLFQKTYNLTQDEICGLNTWTKILTTKDKET